MNAKGAHGRFDFYGKIAFAALVLVVFGEFLRVDRVNGTLGQLVLVFVLGALYAALGILSPASCTQRKVGSFSVYLLLQWAIANALVFVTPLKGFSFLIAMPIVSLATLDLGWLGASVVISELFAACLGTILWTFGSRALPEALPGYSVAFVFTVVFSLAARRALEARQHAEKLSNELAAANEQLRRYAAQADELATARERNRLAREIHDGIGHYLTTINVQLEAAHAVFTTQPAQAAAAIEKAARLSREALDDVRRSVGTLRTDIARPPLPDALQSLAQNLGLAVAFQLHGTPRPLPPAVEHALFRAAQEGLTNVRKHAAATHTDLTLDFTAPERVVLAIADNGRGAPATAAPSGFGLRGMRERIELLGGTVVAANGPTGGFVLRVELPA